MDMGGPGEPRGSATRQALISFFELWSYDELTPSLAFLEADRRAFSEPRDAE
jgi:hypothetical protein